jgi:hypothetical protein
MATVPRKRLRITAVSAAAAVGLGALGLGIAASAQATPAAAAASPSAPGITVPHGFTATVFAKAGGTLSGADDVANLGDRLFVGYQNGVGTKGEPAPGGRTTSTVVEFDRQGKEVAHWDLKGKVDGVGADARTGTIIATVNEDGNSSVYTIAGLSGKGGHATVAHYAYSGLGHGGGTDSVTVHNGRIYLAASAPATDAKGSTAGKPAMYTVKFKGRTAVLTPVFSDSAVATNLLTGKKTALALTDPDSSANVPDNVRQSLGGSLLLVAQGDSELVFAKGESIKVLPVKGTPDDTVFAPAGNSTLYVVDPAGNRIVAVTGHFTPGEVFASADRLSTVNLKTGALTPFGTGLKSTKGLIFVTK